nr:putative CIA30 family protein [uncultured bacterium]
MPLVMWRFDSAKAVEGWAAVDDRVMGGVSRSRLRYDPSGYAVFEGEVSLEQNGGFASVRSPAGSLGLAGASDCLLEVRGAAKHFKLSLFGTQGNVALGYQAEFRPVAMRWTAIRLPIDGFVASLRGRRIPGAPPLDPAHIQQAGIMISKQQEGAFALDVRSIILE